MKRRKLIAPAEHMRLARFDASVANDCAIWCLATFLSVPYERMVAACAKVDRQAGLDGLYFPQMIRVAETFGVRLGRIDVFNVDEDTGILGVRLPHYAHGHVVILKRGQIVDMRGKGGPSMWDADVFLATHRARVDGLLVMDEQEHQ